MLRLPTARRAGRDRSAAKRAQHTVQNHHLQCRLATDPNTIKRVFTQRSNATAAGRSLASHNKKTTPCVHQYDTFFGLGGGTHRKQERKHLAVKIAGTHNFHFPTGEARPASDFLARTKVVAWRFLGGGHHHGNGGHRQGDRYNAWQRLHLVEYLSLTGRCRLS